MSLSFLKSIKDDSISHRIMMAMIALTLVIMVIIAGISYGFMRHLLEQNVIKTIEQTARQSDQKLELTINSISEEIMRLSLNSLMINALVDTSGRQAYIDPFFKSYKPKGDIAIKITLCDFMGKPVASNVRNPDRYNDPELLRQTVTLGMHLGKLLTEKNTNRILLAYPVVWEMTGKPEGFLVAEFNVKELFEEIFPVTAEKSKVNLFLLSGSKTVFSKADNAGKSFFKFTDKLHLTPPLDRLDLKMEIADYEEIDFGWLISVYVLAGIFFLALTIWLSGRLSYFLTAHLRALRNTTQKISDSGDLGNSAEIAGPAEVRTLAASFNTMIDKLKESRDLLEMRVEERTEELWKVNKQLQDELVERMRTEEELKKYREHLEILVAQRTAEALRAKHLASIGELAAGVAHEINNPINSIINYAQILKDTLPHNIKEKDFSERIMKEGNRIALIVRSLLSFGREIKEEKELVHIRDLMDEMLVLTDTQLKKDGISLEMRISTGLPQVIANKQQLQQVFLNLISNARYALNQKYPAMDHKNKRIDIHGDAITDDHATCARIVFHDNGTGISDDILDKVTNPFFTTKPSGLGTGLGLSISQGIIKSLGGKLLLESRQGEFTRVTIDLPANGKNGN